MQALLDTSSEVSSDIEDILTTIRDSIGIVVTSIGVELASFANEVAWLVTYNIVGLLDDIFGLYSYEWVIATQRLEQINNWINVLILDKISDINNIVSQFDDITDSLIQDLVNAIGEIDNGVSPEYNERMFKIYGRIAEFSLAIDAPPFYLEGVIQNARFFAMGLACNSGLSYFQFDWEWDIGLNNLLFHITNAITLYRQNPQWIKIDVENLLVIPLYQIERNRQIEQRDLLNSVTDQVTDLAASLYFIEKDIAENKQRIIDIIEFEITPLLKQITDNFDNWKATVYETNINLNAKRHTIFTIGIQTVFDKIYGILGLLDFPADILLRIDKLSNILRIEQEDKINEVSARSFVRQIPPWLIEVRKGIEA